MDVRRITNDITRLRRRIRALEDPEIDLTLYSGSLVNVDSFKGDLMVAGTASHADVSAGNVVYLDSTKQWRRASAGLAGVGSGELISIATTSTPHNDGAFIGGIYRLNSSYVSGSGGSFTIGSQVYLDPLTSGSFTTMIPSGSGQIVRVVGHAVDSDMIYFNPSQDYIEI